MNMKEKKLEVLQMIFKAFEDYNGKTKSELEKQIEKIKPKIEKEDYLRLQEYLIRYRIYILSIIANSKKVFVKLPKIDDEEISSFENFDIEDIFHL